MYNFCKLNITYFKRKYHATLYKYMPKCNKNYVRTNIGFYWILLHSFFYPSVVFYMSYRFVLSLTLLFLSSISKKIIVLQPMNHIMWKCFSHSESKNINLISWIYIIFRKLMVKDTNVWVKTNLIGHINKNRGSTWVQCYNKALPTQKKRKEKGA